MAPRDAVETRALDDGAILVDMKSGDCFELNPIGFEIWKALGQGLSISEICDTLIRKYGVEPGVLAGDVRSLVTSLMKAGLLQVATS